MFFYSKACLPALPPALPVTEEHIPLGFVKNIGNRANNLYPQDWRIRSGYLPENIRILSESTVD